MKLPPTHKRCSIWCAVLFLALPASTALAWTSAEIRQAPMEQWVIQDIRSDPRPDGTVYINYRVTEPVYVILRAHAKFPPFPILRQILPRVLRQPGVYRELWDGRDESGLPLEYIQWQLKVRGEPLNFTPTQDELEGARANPPNPLALLTSHHLHDTNRCGLFRVVFENPLPGTRLSGIAPITLRLMGGFRGYGREIGLQFRLYADQELLNDTRLEPAQVGDLDVFTLMADVSNVPPGRHVLRVVVTDWADHYGTASLEVEIAK